MLYFKREHRKQFCIFIEFLELLLLKLLIKLINLQVIKYKQKVCSDILKKNKNIALKMIDVPKP